MYKEKPEIKGCTQPCLPKRRLDRNGRHHFFVRVPAKTAGMGKRVIQTTTFAPVSCRRLAMDFRKSLYLIICPVRGNCDFRGWGFFLHRTMNDMNVIDKLVKVINKSTLLGREIDVYGSIEEPLFKAKDVAEWIEHSNPSKMVSDAELDETEYTTVFLSTLTNSYSALMLTEEGLYEVLMQSRKPIAKQFKKGVKEILKKIRKTGSYSSQVPQTFAQALMLAAKQQEKIEQQQRLLAEQAPKAEYFDNLVDRNLLTNFRDTAKQLGLKQNQFIALLLNDKYIYRDKKGKIKPYAQYSDTLFKLKDWGGEYKSGLQTLITPLGKETFRLLYNQKEQDLTELNNYPSMVDISE